MSVLFGVRFDLSSLRANVQAQQDQFIAQTQPGPGYVWVLEIRLQFSLSHAAPCRARQLVLVPLPSLAS